jgi:hypothetical protein
MEAWAIFPRIDELVLVAYSARKGLAASNEMLWNCCITNPHCAEAAWEK